MESATAADVKEQVQERAQEATEQARGRVQQELDSRTTQAGESVASTAETVRRVGQSLREEGQDGPAQAAEQAAERIERAGRWLRESDADRIVRDVERFGRERPWAVALGGLALGFAAARMLKASSQDRYRQESGGPSAASASGDGNGHQPGFAELPPTVPTQPPAAPSEPPTGSAV